MYHLEENKLELEEEETWGGGSGWWVGLGVGNLPGNSRNIPRNFWNFRNGPDLLKFSEITEILKSLKSR